MDTYALVALGAAAVLSVVARHVRMVTAGSGRTTRPESGLPPTVVRRTTVKMPACAGLAHIRSLRDN